MKKIGVLLSVFLTACATITHGPNETIAVDSQPSGAAASPRCQHRKSSFVTRLFAWLTKTTKRPSVLSDGVKEPPAPVQESRVVGDTTLG